MAAGWRLPNLWDAVAFLCVIGALVGVGHVARGHAWPDRRAGRDRDHARSAEPAGLRAAHHDADVRRAGGIAAVHLHLRHRRGEKPARGAGAGAGAGRAAVGADPGLPDLHRRVLHEPVPRPGAGAGAGGDLRDLHQPGLEHGVQHVPVAEDGAGRPARGLDQLPPDRLAAVLEAGGAVRRRPAWCGTP